MILNLFVFIQTAAMGFSPGENSKTAFWSDMVGSTFLFFFVCPEILYPKSP